MGLEDTNILRKIAGIVGIALGKKSKKDQSASKGAKNRSSGKSGTAKKRTGQSAAMDMAASLAHKQFMLSEMIQEPVFRYVPDRDTIQRLITRASNMKDDLAEFDLFQDTAADAEGMEGQEEVATQQN